jgi:hypothetical protein
MLSDRVAKLSADIDRLADAKRIAAQAQLYATRGQMLADPVQELVVQTARLAALRRRGITAEVDARRIASLRAQLDRMVAEYRADPETLLAADGQRRFTFWQPLRELPRNLGESIEAAWMRYVESRIVTPPIELLAVLGNVPAFVPQVATIRGLHQQLLECKKRVPSSDEDIDRVDQLVARLRAAITALHGEGIPASVLAFLRAAALQGASLDLLTQDVLAWIDAHGLRGDFLVMPARVR